MREEIKKGNHCKEKRHGRARRCTGCDLAEGERWGEGEWRVDGVQRKERGMR